MIAVMKNIVKRYGDQTILDNLNLEVSVDMVLGKPRKNVIGALKMNMKKIVAVTLLATIFLFKGEILPIVSYGMQASEVIDREVDSHKESANYTCDSDIKAYTKNNAYKSVVKYYKNQTT